MEIYEAEEKVWASTIIGLGKCGSVKMLNESNGNLGFHASFIYLS
jgi:hypothetical protein